MIVLSTHKARLYSVRSFSIALLTVLLLCNSILVYASDFTNDIVITSGVSQGNAFTRSYNTRGTGSTNGNYQSNYLGDFKAGANTTDKLTLDATAQTVASTGENVLQPQLQYRVYRSDYQGNIDDLGNLIGLPLALDSGIPNATAQWSSLDNSPRNTLDLLSFVNSPGVYTVQVYFQAPIQNSSQGTNSTIYDNNGGLLYVATFNATYNGSATQTIKWNTASKDGDWFNNSNWSPNVIPNSNSNVIIPYSSGGNYPNITGSQPAQVRNLLLSTNNSGSLAAQLNLNSSQLLVYGNFQDTRNGFKQNAGTLTLAGTQDQTFDNNPNLILYNLQITGGGNKTITNPLAIAAKLEFLPTSVTAPAGVVITTGQFNITLQKDAFISGETEGAYIRGLVAATRDITTGQTNTFGNIGFDLNISDANPGSVAVLRDTYIYYGAGTSMSVERGFTIQPSNPAISQYTVSFHYLNALLNSINPTNLQLFRSDNGDIPFTNLGKTSNDTNMKILTRTAVPGTIGGSSNSLTGLFTLGDQTNPLPVTLTSFTATGTTLGAALKWITASELNNKGFGVERQVAGSTTWESVGYVAGTNAANGSSYNYLDKTIPAGATQVYYRLRQEDKTGELTYSPVAAISRAAAGAALTLSPVPLDSSPLLVSFAEAGQAGAVIEVINMQGQRVSRFTTDGSTDGGVSLPLNHLAPGVYIVNVQVAGQATRHARFVKQ